MQTVLKQSYARTATPQTIWTRIRIWLDLWSERRSLASLDRRMLADIGIEESAARLESRRSVFDIPHERDFGGRYGPDV
ncbi:MAG: hypothetical protein AAGJ94_07580 [Pseudomonadota bacterium]